MIKVGLEPILECSSKGDKRFSAFYARLKCYNNQSIEEIYQKSKIFEGGITGLSVKEAKGKPCTNQRECAVLYSQLWDTYLAENPELWNVMIHYRGFSDIFGQEGSVCQAKEIYRLWIGRMLRHTHKAMKTWDHLIVNVRKEPCEVYCGRGSRWGNPYTHIPNLPNTIHVKSVHEAIAQYRYDFIEHLADPEFRREVKSLKGKVLGCYCKGKHLCHTAVISGYANSLP